MYGEGISNDEKRFFAQYKESKQKREKNQRDCSCEKM
jgi:hypothetical protein